MLKKIITLFWIAACVPGCALITGESPEEYQEEPPVLSIHNIDMQPISDSSVKLSWSAYNGGSEAVLYTLWRNDGGETYQTLAGNLEDTVYIDTGLLTIREYDYRLEAKTSENSDQAGLHIDYGQSNNSIFSYQSPSFMRQISFSRDGEFLAGSGQNFIYIWNTANWDLAKLIDVEGSFIPDHLFSSGGKFIYARNSMIVVLSMPDWNIEKQMDIHTDVQYFTITPDQTRLIIGAPSGLIEVYDMESGSILTEIDSLEFCYGLLANPDNETLTSFSYGLMRIYSLSSGNLVKEVENTSNFFHSPRFNQDSTEMVVLKERYGDRTIEIFDTESWVLKSRIMQLWHSNQDIY